MPDSNSIQTISVIVPKSPFVRSSKLHDVKHCLAALDVEKLMEWWPGKPHTPNRDAKKVRAIQRSLDWKRVAQIAAYLLQQEIVEAPERIDEFFRTIYEPTRLEPGRQWPPKIPKVIGFERSEYPTFSNVLLHVNGAKVEPITDGGVKTTGAANLVFDESSNNLHFSVIDGQHRINGAYFAIRLLRETFPDSKWEIPSDLFIDLDPINAPPRHQAQIFIDVNFYQKKVDRSLVADLFPTARGGRTPLDDKERAQDIGRRLMLDVGPLVGMIQIPGIKYGVKDVVTLATLNSSIEDVLEPMGQAGIVSLDEQTRFIAQCLDAWLEASGRRQEVAASEKLDSSNVVYQGRVACCRFG
jgi:DGQHR domain-containing protein